MLCIYYFLIKRKKLLEEPYYASINILIRLKSIVNIELNIFSPHMTKLGR